MKKKISLLLVAVLLLTGLAAGCGTTQPTATPTVAPTEAPTAEPTATLTSLLTAAPTEAPTATTTAVPTEAPTAAPTDEPAVNTTAAPVTTATVKPTAAPTKAPTAAPTPTPTPKPTPTPTPVPITELDSMDKAQSIQLVQKSEKTDYMLMYFSNGTVKTNTSRDLIVKSGRYGFVYDTAKNAFKSMGLCNDLLSSDMTGATDRAEAFSGVKTTFTVHKDGKSYTMTSGGGYGNWQLIRSGNVIQSFQQNQLRGEGLVGPEFRTEVNATANHFSIYYDAFVDKSSHATDVEGLTFTLEFAITDSSLTKAVWANGDVNSGILTLKNADGTKAITFVAPVIEGRRDKLELIGGNTVRVTSTAETTVKARSTASRATKRTAAIGLIVVPNQADPNKALHYVYPANEDFLEAKGFAPYERTLKVEFDFIRGLYEVTLRNTNFGSYTSDALERADMILANRFTYDTDFLVMFKHQRGAGIGLVGTVPMLRDKAGNPMGIPFQVSKNWHILADSPEYNDGQWQEYYVNVFVPANKKVNYEFSNTYAKWGKTYAASHAQLCLIGWANGNGWLWEEAALGNYTENICYAPGTESFGQDVRGYMFTHDGSAINGFANNVGGMDYLVYWNKSGKRVDITQLAIDYYAHGPNLSTVIYSGVTSDGAIRVRYTSRLLRADDFARIFHTFEYEFLKDVDASRIIFYTYGAEQYNEAYHDRLAYGNADGLIKEFSAAELEKGAATKSLVYITNGKNIALNGASPWVSWLGTDSRVACAHQGFGYADRGLVVREYAATVNGKATTTPYLSIRSAKGWHAGHDTNIVEIGGGTDKYTKGDKVRGTVEIFVMPQTINQYKGPTDTSYYNALSQYVGKWQLVHYMATKGAVTVKDVTGATVEGQYPATLKKTGNEITFTLVNGNGYAPVVIRGLDRHDGWVLEEKVNGNWVSIATYQENFGNDYWQCKYDPVTDTYELTYNVNLAHGASATQFRFRAK